MDLSDFTYCPMCWIQLEFHQIGNYFVSDCKCGDWEVDLVEKKVWYVRNKETVKKVRCPECKAIINFPISIKNPGIIYALCACENPVWKIHTRFDLGYRTILRLGADQLWHTKEFI